jgi:hypothetical protein
MHLTISLSDFNPGSSEKVGAPESMVSWWSFMGLLRESAGHAHTFLPLDNRQGTSPKVPAQMMRLAG